MAYMQAVTIYCMTLHFSFLDKFIRTQYHAVLEDGAGEPSKLLNKLIALLRSRTGSMLFQNVAGVFLHCHIRYSLQYLIIKKLQNPYKRYPQQHNTQYSLIHATDSL